MDANKREIGAVAEQLAEDFLKDLGYSILKKNFHFGKAGEIDIVAQDEDTLVFVEVKMRTSHSFGSPESAVTEHKRKQIRKVAQGYLYVNQIQDKECRFDVVAIDEYNGEREIRHMKNAFW
jgi:putative endonuclease